MLPHVLIVDDSYDLRILLREMLGREFKACWLEADSGLASTELLQTQPISLVISDLNMPNGSGLWLHQFMVNQKILIPMILFTAEKFDSAGRPKPNSDEILKAVVSKFELNHLIQEMKQLGFTGERH